MPTEPFDRHWTRSENKPVRCAVLAGSNSWHFRDLVRGGRQLAAAGRAKIELRACGFEQLAGGLVSNQPSFSLQPNLSWQADAVLVRVMPAGSLEQIVFRMDLLQRLMLAGTPVINEPKTIEASVDKYLCCRQIAGAGHSSQSNDRASDFGFRIARW